MFFFIICLKQRIVFIFGRFTNFWLFQENIFCSFSVVVIRKGMDLPEEKRASTNPDVRKVSAEVTEKYSKFSVEQSMRSNHVFFLSLVDF